VINSIQSLLRVLTVKVVHSLREGNTLADFLTNLAFDFAGEINFNTADQLPAKGRCILNMDKLGLPNIRRIEKK